MQIHKKISENFWSFQNFWKSSFTKISSYTVLTKPKNYYYLKVIISYGRLILIIFRYNRFSIYVTGFGKTGHVRTRIAIHFIACYNSHTQALSRHIWVVEESISFHLLISFRLELQAHVAADHQYFKSV